MGFYVTLKHSGDSGWENCPSPSSSVQEPPANQLKCHTDPTQTDCRASLGAEGAKILSIKNSLSSSAAFPSFLTPKGRSSTARKGLPTSPFHLHTRKMVLETLLFRLAIAQAGPAIQFGDPAAPMLVWQRRGLLVLMFAPNSPPCQHPHNSPSQCIMATQVNTTKDTLENFKKNLIPTFIDFFSRPENTTMIIYCHPAPSHKLQFELDPVL